MKIKKQFHVLSICLFFAVLFGVFLCLPSQSIAAQKYDYTLEQYQVVVDVKKNNTFHITENITANFNKEKHGIFRKIPVENQVERADGTTAQTHPQVENIDCGEDEVSISREDGYCVLQIGDEDVTITGKKEYQISYDYVMGNDILENADEFYFNIIGTGWTDTTISNVSFTINMPKEFDESKLGMSFGKKGSMNPKGLSYSLQNNVITGKLDSSITLNPKQALTVRLELPEGYFERVDTTPWIAYIAIVLALLGMGVAFLFWWKYGRDDEVVEVVQFHAPDGLNSLELAYAYKGEANQNDIISLLIYLAQKGYIKIEQGKTKKDFIITRLKSYDGSNPYEKEFMKGLFDQGKIVTKNSLKNHFYHTLNTISTQINSKPNKKTLFHENSLNKGWILYIILAVFSLFAAFKPLEDYYYNFILSAGIVLAVAAAFSISFYMLFHPGNILKRLISFLIGIMIAVGIIAIFFNDAFDYVNVWYKIACAVAVIAIGEIIFFCVYLSKRTLYGTEILGKILGFKNFLETAEKDKLEAMVEENPQYFYEILPYTYVLGISNKWMKKFESISIEAPEWYYGNDNYIFDYVLFHSFLNSTMDTVTSSMVSSPSSSSGGGFSGGGSGGGGGGSW